MESIVCPVCETENAPDAQHCEVCGERLAPPAPGEEIPPEENVAAMIADEPEEDYPAAALEALSEPDEFDELDAGPDLPDDDVLDAGPDLPDDDFLDSGPDLPDDEYQPTFQTSDEEQEPEFLYSTHDGTAYPKGSPEYEEGFGPMGEELVADEPQLRETGAFDLEGSTDPHADPGSFDVDAEGGGFEMDSYDDSGDEPPSPEFEPEIRASAAFQAAFQVKEKEKPSLAPLPQPGTHVEPARITLYVNREPVHTHYVETDETLIGRRDPRADAFPDLDLTDFDDDAHISRKHAFVYRQNKNYTLYVVSNSGTQLNADLLELGDRRPLADGDVIVLAGKLAMKFEIPEAH